MGIHDDGYTPRIILYILFGLLDAMWQTTSYWLIGAMSNSPARLAYFTGFCSSHLSSLMIQLIPYTDKSMQSAGAAGVWRADGVGVP